MKTRLAQILSRFIGVGLMALAVKFGTVDDETANTINANADAIGTALAAVLFFAADFAMHNIQWKKAK